MVSVDDLNFVKTQSSIYSSFHKSARTINFDIGYSKEAKWFETLNNKWNEYSNFHIGGFLEDIYSVKENDNADTEITYAQIDAKIIDYDTRFRHQKSTSNTQSVTSPKSTNTFAKRRTSTLSSTSTTTHLPHKSNDNNSTNSSSVNETQNYQADDSNDDPIKDNNPVDDDDQITSPKTRYKRKRKATDNPINEDQTTTPITTKENNNRKKRSSRSK